MAGRDDDPILGPRKGQLGGPGPRAFTYNADEWNRLVDKVFAAEADIDAVEASVAAVETSLASLGVLYEMPISVTPSAPFLPAVFVRGTGDTGSPSGSVTYTVEPSLSDPTQDVLRMTTSGGACWIAPIDLGAVALPAEGYVLEVEVDRYPVSTWYGLIAPILDVVDDGGIDIPRGLYMRSWNGAVNIDWMDSKKTSGPYGHMQDFTPSPTLAHWPSTPSDANLECGPYRLRCEVRRTSSLTPARWTMRYTAEGIGVVHSASISGVSEPRTALDGRPLGHIGIGIYGGAGSFDIKRLRVLSLD